MTLNEQVKNWIAEGAYQTAVDAIGIKRWMNPELPMLEIRARNLLAQSWLDSGTVEDREIRDYAQETLELLEELRAQSEKDLEWLYQRGIALCLLNREWEALSAFRLVLRQDRTYRDTRAREQVCAAWLNRPVFRENFAMRADAAWQAFLVREPALHELAVRAEEHPEEPCPEEYGVPLLGVPHDFFNGITDCQAEIQPANQGHPYLQLSLDIDLFNIIPCSIMQDRAPEEVLRRWEVVAGRIRRQDARMVVAAEGDLPEQEISWDDVRVWIREQENERRVLLVLYCEKLADRDLHSVKDDLQSLVIRHVGEMSYLINVGAVAIAGEPFSAPSCSLREVLGRLKAREGTVFFEDARTFLVNFGVQQFDPPAMDDVRKDVKVQYSVFPDLLFEYWEKRTGSLRRFQSCGITIGYLYCPIRGWEPGEGETSSDVLERADRFMMDVCGLTGKDRKEVLAEATAKVSKGEAAAETIEETRAQILAAPERIAFLLGVSFGTERIYFDVATWDLDTLLERAKAAFAGSAATWASYRSLDPNAQSIQVYKKPAVQAAPGRGIGGSGKGNRKKKKRR